MPKSNESFYYPPSVRESVFFKADSQPEVLANEHLDGTPIGKSCALPIEVLLYKDRFPRLFQILSDEEIRFLNLENSFREKEVLHARYYVGGAEILIKIDKNFLDHLSEFKVSKGRDLTREELQEVMCNYVKDKNKKPTSNEKRVTKAIKLCLKLKKNNK